MQPFPTHLLFGISATGTLLTGMKDVISPEAVSHTVKFCGVRLTSTPKPFTSITLEKITNIQ